MGETKQITTKGYKIKACVIGILVVLAFVASQYIMYGMRPIEMSTGKRIQISFPKWLFDRNAMCMLAGIVIILIPYERIARALMNKYGNKLKKSNAVRLKAIIGTGVVSILISMLVGCWISDVHRFAFVVLSGGIVFTCGLLIFPLIGGNTDYQLYIWVVGFANLIIMYMTKFYEKPIYTGKYYNVHELRFQYLFVSLVYISLMIAAFSSCIVKKHDTLKDNMFVFVWYMLVIIVCLPCVLIIMGMAGNETSIWGVYKLYTQYLGDDMKVLMTSSNIVLLILLAINIPISVIATKTASMYSMARAAVLRWVTIVFVMLTIWQIAMNCTMLYSGYDFFGANYAHGVLVFILLRAMIVPVSPEPEIQCDFDSDTDVNIWNINKQSDIHFVEDESLNEKVDLLINYIKILDIRISIIENKTELASVDSADSKEEMEAQIKEFKEGLSMIEEAGKIVSYKQFIDKAKDINARRKEELMKIICDEKADLEEKA